MASTRKKEPIKSAKLNSCFISKKQITPTMNKFMLKMLIHFAGFTQIQQQEPHKK